MDVFSLKNQQMRQNNHYLRPTLSIVATSIASIGVLTLAPDVLALDLVSDRATLVGNDSLDWSSLGPTTPFNILPNNFSASSQGGLGVNVNVPPSTEAGITPPFVFQTLPVFGRETNFANGDFILFTGLLPGVFPAPGNPGPLSLTFDEPVSSAGAQIAVDDTFSFIASIEAFDSNNNSLGSFSVPATSSVALDNSAIFLGVSSDIANISRISYTTSASNRGFGINRLSLSIESTTVPEPTFTLGLLSIGVLGIGRKFISNLVKQP
jgi:hypothetical protein